MRPRVRAFCSIKCTFYKSLCISCVISFSCRNLPVFHWTLDSSRSTPRTSYFRHTNKHFSGPGRAVGTNHRMTQVGWLGPRSAGHFALDLHSSNDYGHYCNIVVNNDIGIMRSHRTHCIDATYCYRCRTYRGLSVCESVSVCWTRE